MKNSSSKNIKNFKILDLFSGAGGFSYGISLNKNFDTVLANDFNESALKTLKHNKKNVEIIYGDITKKEVKNEIVEKSIELNVNMIIGGPPCQGFSLQGKKGGIDDPRNFLFREYLDIVEKVNPEIFIIENVKNMIHSNEGFFINQIIDEFTKLGYMVSYKILKSIELGVPQKRERAIIIGSKSNSISFDLLKRKKNALTVEDAISDLNYLNSGEGEFVSEYLSEAKSTFQKTMRKNSKKLFNHKATNHSELAIKKLKLIPVGGTKKDLPERLRGNQKFSSTWSRLKWDEPSPTIDTRFDTPSNGKNSHPILNRAITPREAARLQSFPDSYEFLGSKTEICKQIGNAVPPLMAKAIGEMINNNLLIESNENNGSKLVNADSYSYIKELISKKVIADHIITDPPYNISQKNNFSTMSNRKGLDFGEWDKDFDLLSWIKEYNKILKPGGSMIIFCSFLFISHIVDELKEEGLEVKDAIRWIKTNPMPRNRDRRYVSDYEFAVWAVKPGAKWTFHRGEKVYNRPEFKTSTVSGKERTEHPTQKSLQLMKDLIEIHSNVGDVIVDPFVGSGTTALAAKETKRKYIAIEKDPKYYKISLERLK